jgi:hypothetical protein
MDEAGERDEGTVHNVLYNSGDMGTPRMHRHPDDEANLKLRPAATHSQEGSIDGGGDAASPSERRGRLSDHIREAVRVAQLAREQLLSRSGRSFTSAVTDDSDDEASDVDGDYGARDRGTGGWHNGSGSARAAVHVVGPAEGDEDEGEYDEEEDDDDDNDDEGGREAAANGADSSFYELTFDDCDLTDFPLLASKATSSPRNAVGGGSGGGGGGGGGDGGRGGDLTAAIEAEASPGKLGREADSVMRRHGELVMRTALGPSAEWDERRRAAAALALRRRLFSDTERLRARVFAQQREHTLGAQSMKESKEAERQAAEAQCVVRLPRVHSRPPAFAGLLSACGRAHSISHC